MAVNGAWTLTSGIDGFAELDPPKVRTTCRGVNGNQVVCHLVGETFVWGDVSAQHLGRTAAKSLELKSISSALAPSHETHGPDMRPGTEKADLEAGGARSGRDGEWAVRLWAFFSGFRLLLCCCFWGCLFLRNKAPYLFLLYAITKNKHFLETNAVVQCLELGLGRLSGLCSLGDPLSMTWCWKLFFWNRSGRTILFTPNKKNPKGEFASHRQCELVLN